MPAPSARPRPLLLHGLSNGSDSSGRSSGDTYALGLDDSSDSFDPPSPAHDSPFIPLPSACRTTLRESVAFSFDSGAPLVPRHSSPPRRARAHGEKHARGESVFFAFDFRRAASPGDGGGGGDRSWSGSFRGLLASFRLAPKDARAFALPTRSPSDEHLACVPVPVPAPAAAAAPGWRAHFRGWRDILFSSCPFRAPSPLPREADGMP
jgi:hypothetical protein